MLKGCNGEESEDPRLVDPDRFDVTQGGSRLLARDRHPKFPKTMTSERPVERSEQPYYDCKACQQEAEAAKPRAADPNYGTVGYYSYNHSHSSTSAPGWLPVVGNITPVPYYPAPPPTNIYPNYQGVNEYSTPSSSRGSASGGDRRARATKAARVVSAANAPVITPPTSPSPQPSPKRINEEEPARRYVCPSCGFGFVRNHDLTRHIRGHNNELFKCDKCGKMYGRKDSLRRHQNGRCDGVDNFIHRPQGYNGPVAPFAESNTPPPNPLPASSSTPRTSNDRQETEWDPVQPQTSFSRTTQKVSHFQYGGLVAGSGQN